MELRNVKRLQGSAAGTAGLVLMLLTACGRSEAPIDKDEAVRLGDRLFADGQFSQAVVAYRQAVSADRQDGRVRIKLVRAYERTQQWVEAGREAMRAADLLPGDYDAGILAARLVLGLSRFEDSRTLSTALLRSHPNDADLLVLWSNATARLASSFWAMNRLGPTGGRGEAYERACTGLRPQVAMSQDQEAEATLRRVLALAPTHFEGRFALIGLLWATRRADESGPMLQQMADEFPKDKLLNEAAGHFFLARDRPDLGERYLRNAALSGGPEARASRLALADRYLTTGRHADALALLEGLGAAEDEGGVVSVRRARATIGLGRLAEALGIVESILVRHPLHADALTLKSRALLGTRDVPGAIAAGQLAVKADPLRSEAHRQLGRALEASEDVDGAYREYVEAFKQDPDALELAPKLAQLGLATDRPRAALVYARQASGAFPNDAQARLTMVEALIRAGDYKAADFWLAPVLRQADVPADAHVLRAASLSGRGDENAARAALRDAERLAPGSVKVLAALVELDLSRRRIGDARTRVDQALSARPDDPDVLRLSGIVRLAEGDLAGAEAVLRRARTYRPADTDAALLLAQTLSDLRRPQEARTLLEEVLRRRPSSLVAQTSLAGLLEGMGRLNEAERIYQQVLAEYPDAVRAAARLAVVLVSLGRQPSIALNALTLARRTAPDDPAVNDALGWVELHLDRVSVALPYLEMASRREPGNATFQYHLGVAYVRAGRLDAARSALARSLTLDPAMPDRARAEAELAKLR